MSITLELSPDIEARLIAQASARGISVEELLKVTIDTLLTASEQSSSAVLSPQERAENLSTGLEATLLKHCHFLMKR
ncbi:hypothetical protein [Chlorogloeopsis sp. ULAP02]|uniref:hypothetical protein n=1 Tax=Chlorogloeopsis sp. ULAP02 TaxID=3107926 RepID=UPI003134C463